MKNISLIISSRTRNQSGRSGQAMLELVFVVFMMIVMLFALIDFGRYIYEKQILVNLSREGANLASRGSGNTLLNILTNAAEDMIISGTPLNMSSEGTVIVSAVTNSNNVLKVTAQVTEGSLGGVSKIGSVGGTATMPATTPLIPASNTTCYVAEAFYTFQPITSLGKLMKFALPTTNYDVAYF